MDGPLDLQTKYNKIAAEYSKLRAQIPVLKKAVTDEVARNIALRDDLKQKDQQLRIAESEADSLSFRNQQLTCRVTVLQQELESLQNSSKKGGSKNFEGPNFLKNFDEEFSKKVTENATLIFTLNEYKERHEFEIKALKDEIDSLRLQLSSNDGEKTIVKLSTDNQNKTVQSHKSILGETIQKALEKQLFETQQALQETKVERDRLKQKLKLREENVKNGCVDVISNKEFENSENVDLQESNSELGGGDFLPDGNLPRFVHENGSINLIPSPEIIARENAIKRSHQHRVDKLLSDILMYKSKAETFEHECVNIKSRLESEILRHNILEEQIEIEKKMAAATREELSTTAANYENQLSAMSDHLAGLNDIIAEQKDKMESLQYEIDMISLNPSLKGKK